MRLSKGGGITGLVLAACVLCACASEPASPEAQVRAVLNRAEEAAEARDLATLRALISEDYLDERGQNKQAVAGMLQFYFMQHRSIFLVTRITNLAFPEPARAQVGATIGMAGRPGEAAPDPAFLHADLYWFDFTLVDEGQGDWKLTHAAWRRAGAGEAP